MPDAAASSVAPAVGAHSSATTAPAAGETKTPAAVVAAEVAKPGEAKADATKYKVKIDGVEKEVTLDELQKGYQLESSARKRQQEATESKKIADGIVAAAKAGDYEALVKAGLTDAEIEQLSIKVLSAKHRSLLEEERRRSMDPGQREVEDKLRELDTLKAEKKKQEDSQRAQRVDAAKQQLSKAVIDTMQEFPESVRRNEALAQNVFEAWAFCVQHPDEAKELGIDATPKGISKALKTRQREVMMAMLKAAAEAKAQEQEELTEEEVAVLETLVRNATAKKRAAAEKKAHPSLTSVPKVRGADKKDETPRRSNGAKLRELTLGSLGIK